MYHQRFQHIYASTLLYNSLKNNQNLSSLPEDVIQQRSLSQFNLKFKTIPFLNQARATWFPEITFVRTSVRLYMPVLVSVCPPLRQ